ncbi:MAG: zinc ribbon domain-containing protein [Clostridia bacterium]|nr:zinc ribbon domain-containing protein [Clostridia bacterium]
MECVKCHAQISKGSKFCKHCGAKVERDKKTLFTIIFVVVALFFFLCVSSLKKGEIVSPMEKVPQEGREEREAGKTTLGGYAGFSEKVKVLELETEEIDAEPSLEKRGKKAGTVYEKWMNLVDEVYEYVLSTTELEIQADSLHRDYIVWQAEKDRSVEAEGGFYDDINRGVYSGNMLGIELCREEFWELMSMCP